MPAIEQNCNVMVPVKENKGLFVNNDEKSVKQFTVGCGPWMDSQGGKQPKKMKQYV
jgi:hypothetical protein